MTSQYQLLGTGRPTTADDPERGMWYATHQDLCGYWTDDWTKLGRVGSGIPACPTCGCVGMQMTVAQWFEGARKFEADGKPRYVDYLEWRRELCARHTAGWMDSYAAFVESLNANQQEEQP